MAAFYGAFSGVFLTPVAPDQARSGSSTYSQVRLGRTPGAPT